MTGIAGGSGTARSHVQSASPLPGAAAHLPAAPAAADAEEPAPQAEPPEGAEPGAGAAVGEPAPSSSSLPPAPSRPRRALLPPRLRLSARSGQRRPPAGRAVRETGTGRGSNLPGNRAPGPLRSLGAAGGECRHRAPFGRNLPSLLFPHRPSPPGPARPTSCSASVYFKQFNFKNILFSAKITFHFHTRPHLQLHQARSRTRRDMQWQRGESGAGGGHWVLGAAKPQGRSASLGLQHPAASFPIPGIAGT